MISQVDIVEAGARIRPHVRRTPTMRLDGGAFGLTFPMSMKREFLQHAGSFKPRGAFNTLVSAEIPGAGVAAASGGNHGIAVAYAAHALGHRARIFVPTISSPAKIAAIRSHGAELVIGGDRYAEALVACETYVAESGALSVHAYDAWPTIAGQGTVGMEWEEDDPALQTVLVAVGGGGLIAGLATWFTGRVKVVGVEPEGSTALASSLAAGRPVDVTVDSIAADSLGAANCGPRVFEVASRFVDDVVLVPDAAIREAQRRLWSGMRIAAEPGGATALAAIVSGAYRPAPGERVGVLLCGANVGLDAVPA